MRIVTLTVLGFILMTNSGCGNSNQDSKIVYIRPGQLEIELEKMYQSHEEYGRKVYKISDQKRMNKVIQSLINQGALEQPYIFEKVNNTIQKTYVSYEAYKEYRATHVIDTTLAFYDTLSVILYSSNQQANSVPVDSTLIKILADSLQ